MILKIILAALCANLLYTNANLMLAASSELATWQSWMMVVFDKRIDEINARIDSVRADVAKVWNVARETKANTDSIKTEVRSIDGKIDALQKDVSDIKETSHKIEFKLF